MTRLRLRIAAMGTNLCAHERLYSTRPHNDDLARLNNQVRTVQLKGAYGIGGQLARAGATILPLLI
jgi:hypothetical protein